MKTASETASTHRIPKAASDSSPARKLAWLQRFKPFLMPALAIPLDAVAVSLAFYLAHVMRFNFGPLLALIPIPEGGVPPWAWFSRDLAAIIPGWLFFHYFVGLYREDMRPFEDELLEVAQACFLGSMATLAIGFLYQRFENSRLMILLAFPISTVLVLAGRQLSKRVYIAVMTWTQGHARILLLGNGKMPDLIKRRLEKMRRAVCFMLEKATVAEILDYCTAHRISEVIVIQLNIDKEDLLALSDACEMRGVELKIVPGLLEVRMGEVQVDKSLGLPMFHICHVSFSGMNFATKRLFDLIFCAVFFAVFAIPLAFICLLIKLDSPGPVLFKQRRFGYKGRPFDIYKFRTMVVNAEAMQDDLKHLNEREGALFKIKNDPRITRVGRWLRRFSLDEIPQFLSVLKGDMSVVGPRPLPSPVEDYGPLGIKRLNVLPGITGLWQVSGRSDLDFNQMVALDLYYLEHWSPGLDLKIILKTPAAVFSSKGAY